MGNKILRKWEEEAFVTIFPCAGAISPSFDFEVEHPNERMLKTSHHCMHIVYRDEEERERSILEWNISLLEGIIQYPTILYVAIPRSKGSGYTIYPLQKKFIERAREIYRGLYQKSLREFKKLL